jgi:formamidopyrimidine-DNA glycosylase
VLAEWIEGLRQDAGDDFPEGVTAFRPAMALHGRYGRPCPECRRAGAAHTTRPTTARAAKPAAACYWPKTVDEWEARCRPAG